MTRRSSSHSSRRTPERRRSTQTRRHTGTQYVPRDGRARVRAEDGGPRNRNNDRTARRVNRKSRTRTRSIGADVLSFPASRALGLGDTRRRTYGRGETAYRTRGYEDPRGREVTARPAVYTDKTTQRTRPTVSLGALGMLGRVPMVIAIVIVVAALVVGVLWGPARAYYLAWRESEVLKVEYAALVAQNEALDHDLDRLQSLEGIEDEARRRGYVYPGEEALVVKGVEDQQQTDPSLVQRAVDEYEANQPWYVLWLDAMFGYQSGS